MSVEKKKKAKRLMGRTLDGEGQDLETEVPKIHAGHLADELVEPSAILVHLCLMHCRFVSISLENFGFRINFS
jgi:hypothetical protein